MGIGSPGGGTHLGEKAPGRRPEAERARTSRRKMGRLSKPRSRCQEEIKAGKVTSVEKTHTNKSREIRNKKGRRAGKRLLDQVTGNRGKTWIMFWGKKTGALAYRGCGLLLGFWQGCEAALWENRCQSCLLRRHEESGNRYGGGRDTGEQTTSWPRWVLFKHRRELPERVKKSAGS